MARRSIAEKAPTSVRYPKASSGVTAGTPDEPLKTSFGRLVFGMKMESSH